MSYNQEDRCQGSKDEGLREVRDYTVRIRMLKHSKHVSCWRFISCFNEDLWIVKDCEAVCQMLVANWCYLFSFFVFICLMLMSSLGCLLALLWEGLWLELFRWDKSLVYLSFCHMQWYCINLLCFCVLYRTVRLVPWLQCEQQDILHL